MIRRTPGLRSEPLFQAFYASPGRWAFILGLAPEIQPGAVGQAGGGGGGTGAERGHPPPAPTNGWRGSGQGGVGKEGRSRGAPVL